MAKPQFEADILARLFAVIEQRRGGDPAKSYVAKRLGQGEPRIGRDNIAGSRGPDRDPLGRLRNRGGEIEPGTAEQIGTRFTVVALVSGLLWGLPGIFFYPENPIALQGFIVFVLGGMSAGAVATMSPHLPAYFGFVLLTLTPVIGQLFYDCAQGGPGSMVCLAMGIMGLVYLALLLGAGRNINKMLTRSLTLQIEKGDLAEIG